MSEEAVARRLLELYQGREDFFARAFTMGSNGDRKAGYVPESRPLTIDDIQRHLRGETVIGVYPIRRDSTCLFGAIDIDAPEEADLGLATAQKIRQAAADMGFPDDAMLVSFSGGKGHHVDLFLAEPVRAGTVRLLLQAVLDKAELNPDDFELFPKQDSVPEDPVSVDSAGEKHFQLGNLIKLPLATHPLTGRKAEILSSGKVKPAAPEIVFRILSGYEPKDREDSPRQRRQPPQETYVKGHRTKRIESLAGILNREGVSQVAAESACLDENDIHCAPPLSRDKVLETVRGIYGRYQAEHRRGPQARDWALLVQPDPPSAPPKPPSDWPESPSPAAFHGLASRVVDLVTQYVEADEVAVLCQFLAAFGVAVGRDPDLPGAGPHFMVGATKHPPALYVALVGASSRGRKGTSWDPVESLLGQADMTFPKRVFDGVGSGEKLVHLVHDAKLDEQGNVVEPAVRDKRLLLQAPELGQLLVTVNREGSTMSQVLRNAFDGKPLRNLVKTNAAEATSYHIGVVGQSTPDELRQRLTEESIRNGLGNRIAYFLTKRRRRIAEPEAFTAAATHVSELAEDIRAHLEAGRRVREMRRSPAARELWTEWYESLPDEIGTVGALCARAEAHVLRLSMVYALTDGAEVVEREHLEAAIALWDYCRGCVEQVFGSTTGDLIADRILEELADGPLTRTQISSEVFTRNLPAFRLEQAVSLLRESGRVEVQRVPRSEGGRPTDLFRLPVNSSGTKETNETNKTN